MYVLTLTLWRVRVMCILLGCSISLIPFYRNRVLLCRFNVTDYNKTYLVLM
jgi:hypothetical protein